MKNIGLLIVLVLATFAGEVSAQVNVEILVPQDQFLPGESIPIKVKVVNNSGQTIQFGKEDWLDYSVEARNGYIIAKTGTAPQAHDFDIKAAEMATARTDLQPYFSITHPGNYTVTATVHIKDWDKNISSVPKSFDIVSGTKVWEQDFGVPQPPDNHSEPEVRKYILQQATLARQMKLYLRVTDAAEAKTMRLLPVGPMISFANPQTRVDRASNLHLLYQQSARIYSYTVFNPDGELKVRQTYYYSSSAPKLKTDEAGNAVILGGVRHPSDNDVPTPQKSIVNNDLPPPVP